MAILVTGGAGFIGSNYCHYVVNKYPEDKFVCLDALTYAGNYNNIKDLEGKDNYKFVKGDITDRDFIDKLFNVDKKRLDEVIKKARPVEIYAEQMANLSDEEFRRGQHLLRHKACSRSNNYYWHYVDNHNYNNSNKSSYTTI